ncbi:hypothetical protein Hanom_Chr07g00590431 [Helianthus anomalus]
MQFYLCNKIPDEETITDKDQLRDAISFNGTGAGEKELPHQLSYTSKASKATDSAGPASILNSTATFSVYVNFGLITPFY